MNIRQSQLLCSRIRRSQYTLHLGKLLWYNALSVIHHGNQKRFSFLTCADVNRTAFQSVFQAMHDRVFR